MIQSLGPKTQRRPKSDAAIPNARSTSQTTNVQIAMNIRTPEWSMSEKLAAINAIDTIIDVKPSIPDRDPNNNSEIRLIIPINIEWPT